MVMTMSDNSRDLAVTYFQSWKDKDFDKLRTVLADDVTFRGPLGTADSADECLAGLRGMAQIMTDLVIDVMVADGNDVITFFDLHTDLAAPAPTANWMHTDCGLIVTIRVAFDARELAAALGR